MKCNGVGNGSERQMIQLVFYRAGNLIQEDVLSIIIEGLLRFEMLEAQYTSLSNPPGKEGMDGGSKPPVLLFAIETRLLAKLWTSAVHRESFFSILFQRFDLLVFLAR